MLAFYLLEYKKEIPLKLELKFNRFHWRKRISQCKLMAIYSRPQCVNHLSAELFWESINIYYNFLLHPLHWDSVDCLSISSLKARTRLSNIISTMTGSTVVLPTSFSRNISISYFSSHECDFREWIRPATHWSSRNRTLLSTNSETDVNTIGNYKCMD